MLDLAHPPGNPEDRGPSIGSLAPRCHSCYLPFAQTREGRPRFPRRRSIWGGAPSARGLPSPVARSHRLRDAWAMCRRSARGMFVRRRRKRLQVETSKNSWEQPHELAGTFDNVLLRHGLCVFFATPCLTPHAGMLEAAYRLDGTPVSLIAANQLTALGFSIGHESTQGACSPARATCCRTAVPAVSMTAHCRLSCLMAPGHRWGN
jgi:hypothetical protein